MKNCPYCAEQIQDEAIKCRYCNETIVQTEQQTISNIDFSAIVSAKTYIPTIISANAAYIGCIAGFPVFAFSMFLPWATIPSGLRASDSGVRSGWEEFAFLALLPLFIACHPIVKKQIISLSNIGINTAIAFCLLAYNNIIGKTSWHSNGEDWGSDFGSGFWIGLLSMIAITICATAWALHYPETETETEDTVN